jgi:hypothetical protein
MRWQIVSSRMPWPSGTVVGTEALAGCNIGALVEGGHLLPAPEQPKSKRTPVVPVPETADEPKEQD